MLWNVVTKFRCEAAPEASSVTFVVKEEQEQTFNNHFPLSSRKTSFTHNKNTLISLISATKLLHFQHRLSLCSVFPTSLIWRRDLLVAKHLIRLKAFLCQQESVVHRTSLLLGKLQIKLNILMWSLYTKKLIVRSSHNKTHSKLNKDALTCWCSSGCWFIIYKICILFCPDCFVSVRVLLLTHMQKAVRLLPAQSITLKSRKHETGMK